jgi:hypothetical protein
MRKRTATAGAIPILSVLGIIIVLPFVDVIEAFPL